MDPFHRRLQFSLIVALCHFMEMLNATIITTSIPTIATYFQSMTSMVSMAITAHITAGAKKDLLVMISFLVWPGLIAPAIAPLIRGLSILHVFESGPDKFPAESGKSNVGQTPALNHGFQSVWVKTYIILSIDEASNFSDYRHRCQCTLFGCHQIGRCICKTKHTCQIFFLQSG